VRRAPSRRAPSLAGHAGWGAGNKDIALPFSWCRIDRHEG
jgi:hypothetical protein